MHLPFHLFRPEPARVPREAGAPAPIVPRIDVQWGRPVFRAPSLPTPAQLSNEVPFFVNFPSRSARRA